MARLEQRLEDAIVSTDKRLIDMAADVRALSPLVISHAEMAVKMTMAVEESRAAHAAVDALETRLGLREEGQRKERKRDRQWMIGTIFVAAGLIIASIQVLLG